MAEVLSQALSIQSIYGLFSESKIFVNRRYQRKLVWTLEEKQKLVGSILNKYPIPAILLAEREGLPGEYEIIDGLQRLHAIVSYIETQFADQDGRWFNVDEFATAKLRREAGIIEGIEGETVSAKDVSTILDYTLPISMMRNATEAEIDDVFDRINTYGHRLSDQERRQAGARGGFPRLVRSLACELRGDVSDDTLELSRMPEISIDLPKAKHGYTVKADEVFWVAEGILRSTHLRDSMDEQCIADVTASIIRGEIIDRSKEQLDQVFDKDSDQANLTAAALATYGEAAIIDEFKFIIDEIMTVCSEGGKVPLREIIYQKRNTNAFPSVFAVIFFAFHELIVKEKKKIANYAGVRDALTDLDTRIETGRKATSPSERRKNVNTIKGLIGPSFIDGDQSADIYENHSAVDLENILRRSEIELSNYELKQGLIPLQGNRAMSTALIEKLAKTAVAIANNGASRVGKILIGVADTEDDAQMAKNVDGVEPKQVGQRFVVGVRREAQLLDISMEDYVAKFRSFLKSHPVSEPLLSDVLSSIDFNDFYGYGVIVLTVKSQSGASFFGDDIYCRQDSRTEKVEGAVAIADIVGRFQS